MELSLDEIKQIIKKPRNSSLEKWRVAHNALDIYVNGGEVSNELELVKNFENAEQKQLRDKIARSTKDTVGYILKPIPKVFTASGSIIDFSGGAKLEQDNFIQYLENLPEGMTIRKWMQTYWMEAFISDPNSVVLVESNEDSKSYPTYKSTNVIHDYTHKWGKLDYLVLFHKKAIVNVGKDEKEVQVYRVYDDIADALYYVDNDELFEFEDTEDEHSTPNLLGEIPAVIVSDLVDKKTNGRKSFIAPITEVLREYMRDSSVHSIYKFLHGFPIFWSYAMKCTTCEGAGTVKNEAYVTGAPIETKTLECPTCDGKRLKVTSDVSDGIRLPIPSKGDDPVLAPNIAGFIQPDLETWKMQSTAMKEMERSMHFSIWGTHVEEEKSNTATGRYIDAQPVNDELKNVADMAQKKEEAIISFIGKLQFKTIENVSVTYGKRYLIETPDILWEKYIDAKERKAPLSTLDHMYKQFIYGEYNGDAALLDQKLKEFRLEPFPHYSIIELAGAISVKQMQSKVLFREWVATEIDFSLDYKELVKKFNEYLKEFTDEEIAAVQRPDESRGITG